MQRTHRNRIRISTGERIFRVANGVGLTLLAVVTLYPFWHVVMASFSSPKELMQHKGLLLWFQGFSTGSYRMVLRNPNIYVGYGNTLFYVIVGTLLNVTATTLGAFVLSRPYIMLKRFVMLLFTFTMYFGGGLIPTYLLVKNLGLINSRFALLLPGLVSTWNLIIMTTSFRSLPESLEESARIDGATDWVVLWHIVLPLSMPILMVMCLYYGVGHWNSWFNAMIYLQERSLYPLQLFLREILIQEKMQEMMASAGSGTTEANDIIQTVKYATIVVSTLPILLVYPYIQRHFVKGVMIGAIKE